MSKYGSVKSEPVPFRAYQVNHFVLIDTLHQLRGTVDVVSSRPPHSLCKSPPGFGTCAAAHRKADIAVVWVRTAIAIGRGLVGKGCKARFHHQGLLSACPAARLHCAVLRCQHVLRPCPQFHGRLRSVTSYIGAWTHPLMSHTVAVCACGCLSVVCLRL